jgi:tRNA pseudouridine55 synthase
MDLTLESLALPELTFQVTCSKGTYIRTLAADLGRLLGCGAHLKALTRLQVGPFSLDQAVRLPSDPQQQDAAAMLAHLVPVADCLPHLPAVSVDPAGAVQVRQGKALRLEAEIAGESKNSPGDYVKIICQHTLVAVAVLDGMGEKIKPVRVFNA